MRLKVFQTHIGFHDLVVAARSMKAASVAWGVSQRLFAQGFARQTKEPEAVSAALAQPGTVLKRPHGQKGPFKVHAEPPKAPKTNPARRQAAALKAREQARKAAAERRREQAEARLQQAARDELADIEKQETDLRRRRRALQKKFHLRSV